MGILIPLAFVVLFVWIVVANKNRVGSLDKIARTGLRGRALVLSASPISTGVRILGRRFESRMMALDVEVPGWAPYVIPPRAFLVPRGLVEPLPGASLDVAVDPRNPAALAVLGPGGFSGPWLNAGPPRGY